MRFRLARQVAFAAALCIIASPQVTTAGNEEQARWTVSLGNFFVGGANPTCATPSTTSTGTATACRRTSGTRHGARPRPPLDETSRSARQTYSAPLIDALTASISRPARGGDERRNRVQAVSIERLGCKRCLFAVDRLDLDARHGKPPTSMIQSPHSFSFARLWDAPAPSVSSGRALGTIGWQKHPLRGRSLPRSCPMPSA